MSKTKEIKDRADLSMKTDTKETRIHKPASPLFTEDTKFIAAQIL
jgi:hypothetical protein